jgi:RHH-type proline utilization regulon transcriptional repressor/proline dehydrogenase/delta 1-pyrroline-5-carboxylate dehydrogenase
MSQWDDAIEDRTELLGRRLLDAAAAYKPDLAERIQDWLLTHVVADPVFRGRMLRFMDVLASLDDDRGGTEAKRLAREYFGDDFPALPFSLRWMMRIARDEHVPAPLVGQTARRAAELFARRFITPPGAQTIAETLRYLGDHGRYPAFDLLGEAVLSEAEAQAFTSRYLDLIAALAGDPAAGAQTPAGGAMLQLSVKLSSLTSQFSPLDPHGTLRRVRPAFEAICDAAERSGIGITVDMEQFEYRDLTWRIFREVLGPGARLAAWPHAGIVVQAYLRDALDHVDEVIEFARKRGAPFQVRLVKGAYWDYETIVAAANRWPPPVHTLKAATDATFEAAAARFIHAHPALRLAVGSHNARSHAVAEALAEAAGLPANAVEHQTLFRTYEGMSRAITDLGWSSRDYVPVGELLPGMAYLVRRVLENSSQAGFLLQSRSGADPDALLAPPDAAPPPPAAIEDDGAPFERAPAARWFDDGFREAFEATLASLRSAPAATRTLAAAGEPLPAAETIEVRSPSDPLGAPIGTVELASVEATARAIEIARLSSPSWASTPVAERARILRAAADLLQQRHHDLAAAIVLEGGRDRADAFAEVEEAIDYLRFYALHAERLFEEHGDRIAPRGVVGVIPPWNFSLAIPCGMTVAALAIGNVAILKPAEQTPLVAGRLVDLLHEAGVPPDALLYLPGRGETVGAALAESPDVAMLAFTGSRAVGTLLHETVSRVTLRDGGQKALVAEMGGKNPILVFADADLDEAVAGVLRSAFGHANQKCSAASRVLVEAPIAGRFRDRLVAATRSLDVGPAHDAATEVNPVIDREAHERLAAAAATAREECEILLDLFERPAGDATLEYGPLIVQLPTARAAATRTATEELFGPILLLMPFDEEAEAIAVANATPYGLTAGVFSRSPETIERVTAALEAGNVYVNRTTTGSRVGVEPFGGMHMSGTGPKAGSPGYLWAFTCRTDARSTSTAAPDPIAHAALPAGLGGRWPAPLAKRASTIAAAARTLIPTSPDAARWLETVATRATELDATDTLVQAGGQDTTLRYDTPRGLGLLRATGPDAAAWLAAALIGGNACLVLDSPALEPVARALTATGVPDGALRYLDGGAPLLRALARDPHVAFVATDESAPLTDALRADLAPTAPDQRWLKALLSPLDGPQPAEIGFLRRFAWPKVIAIRTLRHGADLALDVADRRE